jgi:hypothetical protein
MPQQCLDRAQLITFLGCHKTGGSPGHLHPSCSSDTMDIVLRTTRQIVIHHVTDIRHINSAGCNIRRNKNSDLPSFKSVESTETLGQTSVSMDDGDTMPGLFNRSTESIDPTFCPSKYEDGPSFRPKQCHQQIRLFMGGRMMQRLGHTVGRRRGRCHHYVNSAVQARLDQPGDIRRKRSGKE